MPVHSPSGPHVRREEPKSRAGPAQRAEQTVPMAAEAGAEQLVTAEGAESGGQRICSAGQAVKHSRVYDPAQASRDDQQIREREREYGMSRHGTEGNREMASLRVEQGKDNSV